MNETLLIHSRRLAIYLQIRGFILIAVDNDLKVARKKVFFFIDSDRIQKAMMDYKTDVKFDSLMAAFK
jgi:hypothetical protein